MLAKPAFRALVLTVAAGIPVALVGCGAKDAPNSTGVASTAVNPDDQKSWDDFLKSIDVTPAQESREGLGTERASGKRGVFLIYPVGEVRKVGLRKFRIDVTSDFDAKGKLRFSKGSKTLYEADFDPASLTKESFVAQLPSAVLETLGAGDDVKWGLYFDKSAKTKDIVATFKVIEKAQATKEIAKKIDGNKSLASTPTIRDLARAEILMNYSLYSEAVEVLSDVAASDKTLTAPYLPMANALRRLKLKDSPLFQESQARASVQTRARGGLAVGGPSVGGPGSDVAGTGGPGRDGTATDPQAHGGTMTQPGSTPIAKSAGNAKSGLAAGGSVKPGLREVAPNPENAGSGGTELDPSKLPQDAMDARRAYEQTREMLKQRADEDAKRAAMLKERADNLAKTAQDLANAASNAQSNVQDLMKKLDDARKQAEANPGDAALRDAWMKLQDQLALAQKAAADAQAAAEAAAADAQNAADIAAKAEHQARMSQQAAFPEGGGGQFPKSGQMPDGKPAKDGLTVEQAGALVKTAYENVNKSQQGVADATAALNAAHLQVQNAVTDAEKSAAATALQQAQAQYEAAMKAAAEAMAAAKAAEEALQNAGG